MQKHKASVFSVGKGPTGVIKSVLDTARTDGGRRDEIFVDIVERISCTFNASGFIQASQIDGAIQASLCICSLPIDLHPFYSRIDAGDSLGMPYRLPVAMMLLGPAVCANLQLCCAC